MTEAIRLPNHLSKYPKDPRDNLAWRHEMLMRARSDPVYKANLREFFFRDIHFAFNAFYFTLDVRKRPLHHQPFCTYDFQDEALGELVSAIDGGYDLPFEKSRDMGASWMIVGTFVWFWLNPAGGTDFLMGSRIEDYVDKKGDMRTLMEKARYLVYKLPRWLWPKGFNPKKHDNFMRLTNPGTGASITGESNNANFSTGGRYAAILFDEFAKWESTDKSAWMAAGDATPCRIPNSTPFGAAGQHYDLVTDPTKRKIVMHWSRHNDKCKGLYCVWPKPEDAGDTVDYNNWVGLRSIWYDQQCERRSATEIAQELDIDYIGAGNPVFDGASGKRVLKLLKTTRDPQSALYIEYGESEGVAIAPSAVGREGENCLLVYEEPLPKRSYVIAADVAEGKESGDYSTIKVLCRETKDCVASYFTHHDEVQLARSVERVTRYYTTPGVTPWWGVETNSLGLGVFDLLVEIYALPNAFMMPSYDTTKASVSYRKGWWTSSSSKNVLITGMKSWLVAREGWVDQRCVKEMITFVRNKLGKAGAKESCNDDEVMAWGIALQIDEMVPSEEFRIALVPDEMTGLAQNPFDRELFAGEKELTLEERCLAQALKNRTLILDPTGIEGMIR